MKRIIWVTDDCFADCDFIPIEGILHEFKVHWIIKLNNKNRFKESDFIDFKNRVQGLTIDFVYFKRRARDPRTTFDYLKIYHIIKKYNPHAIYMNVALSSPFMIPLCYKLPKNILIFTAHQGAVHAGFNHKYLNQKIRNLIYNKIKFVHMFSLSQENIFKNLYPNVHIYRSFLGLKDFGKPTKLKKNDDVLRFLSFGTINYTKNIDLLIDAACRLYERGIKNFKVSINGSCRDWKWYQSQIKYPEIFELDIRLIDNDEIPNLFVTSHYLVQPYRVVSQSGPMKIAFNYNLPVIVSNLPGFIDELKEGINGFSFECGNVNSLANLMQYLIENHDQIYNPLLKQMIEYTSQKYSNQVLIESYLSMFNDLLSKNG